MPGPDQNSKGGPRTKPDAIPPVALVTGAGGAIGRAITAALRARGTQVIATDLAPPARLPTGSAPGPMPRALKLDVTSAADVRRVFARVLKEYGRLDLLVNNAGAVSLAPFVELTERQWDEAFAVNTRGVFLCARAAARHMIARGSGGRIVNVSSIAARVGFRFQAHYCAAKAAVLGLTKALALELAPHHITVNAICPGAVDTPMLEQALRESSVLAGLSAADYRRMVLSSIPLGRLQTPEDVGSLVAFLASPGASNMTGEAINLDGGIVRD
ncbi:MAG TPA: SDR family NAD(P)-dependent oxidoreductase [Vicinamibacteria bacterium]|jgi:meso-butanediol dehydrogenase/(S,S)-butanediol dehydrogenase/diacetyl reductase|nr:SDR family NAD(P)-dependent oxidoreductase [Vicinamibacteria bacterium]